MRSAPARIPKQANNRWALLASTFTKSIPKWRVIKEIGPSAETEVPDARGTPVCPLTGHAGWGFRRESTQDYSRQEITIVV